MTLSGLDHSRQSACVSTSIGVPCVQQLPLDPPKQTESAENKLKKKYGEKKGPPDSQIKGQFGRRGRGRDMWKVTIATKN